MKIETVVADYSDPRHARDLTDLLHAYALDPMGGGQGLSDAVRAELASALGRRPHAFSVLCYIDGAPAGLINCFEGFSTFKCKPLVNIHDVVVIDRFRGLGVCQQMMARVEEIARERGCCKLTLEVLEGNEPARRAYLRFGFNGYQLDPENGSALFWEKSLNDI
jgi:ribosomal protein S18 acetylase RimI-like enzyme